MRAHVLTRYRMHQSAIVLVRCVPGSSLLPPPYWKARRPWGRGWVLTTYRDVTGWRRMRVTNFRSVGIGIGLHDLNFSIVCMAARPCCCRYHPWCSSIARSVIAAYRKRNLTVHTSNSELLCLWQNLMIERFYQFLFSHLINLLKVYEGKKIRVH